VIVPVSVIVVDNVIVAADVNVNANVVVAERRDRSGVELWFGLRGGGGNVVKRAAMERPTTAMERECRPHMLQPIT
jgi:hypothetical protein